MTLRKILEVLKKRHRYDQYNLIQLQAWQELEERVSFLEMMVQNGLDLEDEFCWQIVWQGGPK